MRVKGYEGCKWAVSFKITSGSRIVSFFIFLASQRDLSIYGLATIATSFDINIVSG